MESSSSNRDLFPSDEARYEATASSLDDRALSLTAIEAAFDASLTGEDAPRGDTALARLMDETSRSIEKRNQTLGSARKKIANALEAAHDGMITKTAQYLRGLIAFGWLALAGLFLMNGAGLSTISPFGATPEDSIVLARLFGSLGVVGVMGATLMAAVLLMSGKAGDSFLKRSGSDYADSLADEARALENKIHQQRNNVINRDHTPATLLEEVSHAHLLALETKLLFRDARFLDAADRDTADSNFFAGLGAKKAGAYSFGEVGLISFTSLFLGAAIGSRDLQHNAQEVAEKISTLAGKGMDAYPALLNLFLLSILAYAFTGVAVRIASVFQTPANSASGRKVLDYVREHFLHSRAPTASTITAQVQDIIEILRARISPGAGGSRHAADTAAHATDANPADDSAYHNTDDDIPAWRKPAEGPRFVESTFMAAPQQWRTEPTPPTPDKNFPGSPGAKRSLGLFKKPLDG